MNTRLRALQRKLERAELEHLRALTAELHERLEAAERRAAYAEDCAEFWQENCHRIRDAVNSEEGASHRAVGVTKSGELLVVRLDEGRATS